MCDFAQLLLLVSNSFLQAAEFVCYSAFARHTFIFLVVLSVSLQFIEIMPFAWHLDCLLCGYNLRINCLVCSNLATNKLYRSNDNDDSNRLIKSNKVLMAGIDLTRTKDQEHQLQRHFSVRFMWMVRYAIANLLMFCFYLCFFSSLMCYSFMNDKEEEQRKKTKTPNDRQINVVHLLMNMN